MSEIDRRTELYHRLALGSPAQVHQLIVDHARKPETLLQRGLNSGNLSKLGYDAAGMRRLGYSDAALRALGYSIAPPPSADAPSHHAAPPAPTAGSGKFRPLSADDPLLRDGGIAPDLKALLAQGLRAAELREMGWNAAHCKKAGCPTGDMLRLGFVFEELVGICSPSELRREGYGVRELKRFFTGHDLRQAGFSSSDMRLAGYSIRELLALGFNENHIRVAGYSNAELMREGLSRTTREI